jgi:hypothetical protein
MSRQTAQDARVSRPCKSNVLGTAYHPGTGMLLVGPLNVSASS